jgi:hypothetical protein
LTNSGGTRSTGRGGRSLVDLEKLRIIAKETISREDVKYLIGWRRDLWLSRISLLYQGNPKK